MIDDSFDNQKRGSELPLELFDTHCHIHFPDYSLAAEVVLKNAVEAGVERMMLVGCTLEDSKAGFEYGAKNPDYKLFVSVGLHPHEAERYIDNEVILGEFADLAAKKETTAIGECGLDYYYEHSDRESQKKLFRFQLDLAQKHNLPMIFHVREAFDDFFTIIDEYKNIRGVVHSFSATERELEGILKRKLFVGLNGIMTFTRDPKQLEAAKKVPLGSLLLETDAPYLTPKPFRGTMCEPKHVRTTAEFLSELRGEPLNEIANQTTQNALKLFGVK